jgi:hypothetical protein
VVIASTIALFAGSLGVGGCGGSHPPQLAGETSSSAVPTTPTDPAGQLAGLAAAAQDRGFVAGYTYHEHGRSDRTVVVSLAVDGTWSVNIPGGALDGGGDVSMVGTRAGVYQCLLGGTGTTLAGGTVPSAPPSPAVTTYPAPVCVKVADVEHGAPGRVDPKPIPAKVDPVVEHFFTDWLDVLSSRDSPISVFTAKPTPGSSGACYSVEPSAASLAPVVDAGIFCFRPDGTLTAVTLTDSSLTLAGAPAQAAPSDGLPAPVTTGPAAPVHAHDDSTP